MAIRGWAKIRLFERDENGKVTAAKAFQLSGYRQVLEKVLRPNASVISTLAQLKHRYGMWLWQAASTVTTNILLVRTEGGEEEMTRHYAANPKLVEMLNREIGRIDLGIRSMQVVPDQQGPSIRFVHEGLSVPVPLLLESHGTRLFLRVYPLILHALETGGIAVVDELDASIHPLILPEIVGWFHDPGRNPRNAQLWMTCQNASLLEYLIKEEVLFCDKDTSGRTSIYGLSDVQSVRRGDNYYRKYLSGVDRRGPADRMRAPIRRRIPQRRRVFVGCEGESERGYVALIARCLKLSTRRFTSTVCCSGREGAILAP